MLKQDESELLSAYVDKELTGKELTYVQERLTNSIQWREELERIQKTKNLTMALPLLPAPADLLDFMEKEAERIFLKKKSSFWRFPLFSTQIKTWALTGSMATAALFVISFGIHRMHENSFIPLEPLLAAHSHSRGTNHFQQNVLNASFYSSQLKNHVKN